MKTQLKNILFNFLFFIGLFCFTSYVPAISMNIKIGLITSDQNIKIGSDTNSRLINIFTNKEIIKIRKMETYLIKTVNGVISITNKLTDASIGSFTGPIELIPDKGLVFCNDRWYRGRLIIFTNGDKKNITVANNVDIEDYLLSVVPSEIPNKWHKEALKAQAVAARSYSYGYMGRRKSKGYDLESSVEDQVYLGISSEKKSTTNAVKETEGIILLGKDGKPLIALYHSSGGGYTDSIENLWNEKPSEHIKPRPDYDDNSPHFQWYRNYSKNEINNLLKDLNIGEIKDIIPISKSVANRIMWLNVIGIKGQKKLRGEELRRALKLPSSKFNLKIEKDVVKFFGRGGGGGVGGFVLSG